MDVNKLFLLEAVLKNFLHFFKLINTFLEVLCTSALTRELTLCTHSYAALYRHACEHWNNVVHRDQRVFIRVIQLEDKSNFLLETSTKKGKHPAGEFCLI